MAATGGVPWVDAVDNFQRRHTVVAFPLAVVYKFFDDQGPMLAALITFYAFLSVFPLLLLSSSILGFVLQGNPELQEQILRSTMAQFPVIGDQLQRPEGLNGSAPGVAIGLIGAAYGAQRVAAFTQNAMNVAWMVPRNSRPNPFALRLKGLVLICTGGLGVLLITLLTAMVNNLDSVGAHPSLWVSWSISLGIIAVSTLVFVAVFRMGSSYPLTVTRALPGAAFTAVGWHLLQKVGSDYVNEVLKQASVTNGVFAIVIGMFAWMYVGALIVVLGVELNVVRARHLYPRALLVPFTDNVNLTDADKRALTYYAKAQRLKDYQHISVQFENDGQHAEYLAKRKDERRPLDDEDYSETRRLRPVRNPDEHRRPPSGQAG